MTIAKRDQRHDECLRARTDRHGIGRAGELTELALALIDFRPANITAMIENIDPAFFQGRTDRGLLGFQVEELDRRAFGQVFEGCSSGHGSRLQSFR